MRATNDTLPTRRRRGRGDEGVTLLEAAVITPLLLLLVLGIFEYGLVYRDYLTAGDALADGVRIGSLQGPDPKVIEAEDPDDDDVLVSADYSIVAAIREGTAGIPPEWIEKIVIYRVDPVNRNRPPLELLPSVCRDGNQSSASAQCNVYPARAGFYAVQQGEVEYFECIDGAGRACGWDPYDRNEGPQRSEIDYLGVYVKIQRGMITGLFGDTFTLERASVLRLEPGAPRAL